MLETLFLLTASFVVVPQPANIHVKHCAIMVIRGYLVQDLLIILRLFKTITKNRKTKINRYSSNDLPNDRTTNC